MVPVLRAPPDNTMNECAERSDVESVRDTGSQTSGANGPMLIEHYGVAGSPGTQSPRSEAPLLRQVRLGHAEQPDRGGRVLAGADACRRGAVRQLGGFRAFWGGDWGGNWGDFA